MRRSRSPRLLFGPILTALLLALVPGGGPGAAGEALEFGTGWDAPGDGWIESVLAMPNGGVLGFVNFEGKQAPILYRLDRDGQIVWQVELPGLGGAIRMALDPRGGAIICTLSRGLTRVTEDGRIDWELGQGDTLQAIWGLKSCDAVLPLADAVLVLGRAANGMLDGPSRLRIVRIDAAGTLDWVAETSQAGPRYAPVSMTLLPDGDVEVFMRIWVGMTELAPWLRRLSPRGEWRPPSTMERAVPPTHEWGFLETVTLSAQGTILRVGQREDPGGAIEGEYGYCRFVLDEWSADGGERLGEYEMNDSPPVRFRREQDHGDVTYLGLQNGRSFFLVECRYPTNFRVIELAVLEPDRSWRWYFVGAFDASAFDIGPDAIFCICYEPGEVSSIAFLPLPPELRR